MKTVFLFIGHYLAFILLYLLFCDLQGSLWIQLFGLSPSPLFWMPIFVYWSLYRRLRESLLMLYITAYILMHFSSSSFALLCLNLHGLFFLTYFIRSRIYREGPLYFMLIVGVNCAAWPALQSFNFKFIAHSRFFPPNGFSWVMNILLTMLISLLLYQFFCWIDFKIRNSKREALETGYL